MMEANVVKLKMVDARKTEELDERLLNISVFTELDTVQNASFGHIEFNLEIVNGNSVDIGIKHPFDFISYMLLDEEGYPIKTPPSGSRLKRHERLWEDLDPIYRKFTVVKITENDKEKCIKEELLKKIINIGPNSKYKITLQVKKIIDDSKDTLGNIIKIPPGQYKISIIFVLAILLPDNGFDRRLLKLKQIPVNLTNS